MNQEDCDRLADRLLRLAELVRTRGVKSLTVAAEWKGHLRASSGIGGGLRVETFEERVGDDWVEHLAFVPHDPTGEADSQTVDQLRHARLVAGLGNVDINAGTLTNLILATVPRAPHQKIDNTCPDGACENCWTDTHYFQPVEHYKKLCRWCGDFKAAQGQVPPRMLLRLRHAGRRITALDVTRALGRKTA